MGGISDMEMVHTMMISTAAILRFIALRLLLFLVGRYIS